jgi:hypothetical protein
VKNPFSSENILVKHIISGSTDPAWFVAQLKMFENDQDPPELLFFDTFSHDMTEVSWMT